MTEVLWYTYIYFYIMIFIYLHENVLFVFFNSHNKERNLLEELKLWNYVGILKTIHTVSWLDEQRERYMNIVKYSLCREHITWDERIQIKITKSMFFSGYCQNLGDEIQKVYLSEMYDTNRLVSHVHAWFMSAFLLVRRLITSFHILLGSHRSGVI